MIRLPASLLKVVASAILVIPLYAQSPSTPLREMQVRSWAYQPSRFKAEARLVAVEVVVRDGHGNPVAGLTKSDFEVYDNGRRTPFTSFSADVNDLAPSHFKETPSKNSPLGATPVSPPLDGAPTQGRSMVMFFDDVNTDPSDLTHAKFAASRFVREWLSPGDRVALATASGGQVLDLTERPDAILAALKSIQPHMRGRDDAASCPRITPFLAYRIVAGDTEALLAAVDEACACPGAEGFCNEINPATIHREEVWTSPIVTSVQTKAQANWEYVRTRSLATLQAIRASVNRLAAGPGERILLLASSGFLSASLEQEQDAVVNDALRAGVVISSVDAKGLYAEAPARPLSEPPQTNRLPQNSAIYETRSLGERLDTVDAVMARLAESTGGLFFRNNNDLELGFYKLGVVPAVTYLLSFPPASDGKYHRLRIRLSSNSPNYIQARPGYFAPSRPNPQDPRTSGALDSEVLAQNSRQDIPANIDVEVRNFGNNHRKIAVRIRIGMQKLPFEQQRDLHLEKLKFVAALFGTSGEFVTGRESELDLAVSSTTLASLTKNGFSGVMTLDAPPGSYRLRTVIQETVQGQMSAQTLQVSIP